MLPLLTALLMGVEPAPAPAGSAPVRAELEDRASVRYSRAQDGTETVESVETRFLIAEDERRLLRVVRRYGRELHAKGANATLAITAWPLQRLGATPLYTVDVPDCLDAELREDSLLVISCGPEEWTWWEVRAAATGALLFRSAVPLVKWWPPGDDGGLAPADKRYAGFHAPPDNEGDPVLAAPDVIGQLAVVAPGGEVERYVLRDADAARARALRSYWDVTRTLSLASSAARGATRYTLLLRFEPSFPGRTPPPLTVRIPIMGNAGNALDLARAELPKGLRLTPRAAPGPKR